MSQKDFLAFLETVSSMLACCYFFKGLATKEVGDLVKEDMKNLDLDDPVACIKSIAARMVEIVEGQ